jgi:hypothetical protein
MLFRTLEPAAGIRALRCALGVLLLLWSSRTFAEPQTVEHYSVDKAVVRFSAPEIGGVRSPRFIFERELAFEARLEALADSEFANRSSLPYLERHIQAALERSIAETLLAALRVESTPTEAEIVKQAANAKRILLDRIGGEAVLKQAAHAEGMNDGDVLAIFRRRARAALYLDQMVAPMLSPTDSELRQIYTTEPHPYRSVSVEKAIPLLRRWVIGRRLREAFDQYYQNARQRLEVVILSTG